MKIRLLLLLGASLTGCSSVSQTVSFPMLEAWFEGQRIYYITTDVSDAGVAADMQANYAPRLRQAIPRYPKPPQVKTVLERVYAFPGGEQLNSVFASAPNPLGHNSRDGVYSPLWLMFVVRWQTEEAVRELRSEEDILAAEASGLVTVERTDVVLNCPIISLDGIEKLPLR